MIRNTRVIVALCIVTAAASFVVTLAARARQPGATSSTLNISTRQWQRAAACDPAFRDESSALSAALDQERAALADLLENDAASDEVIRAQIEKVIAAHTALERRAAEHLLKVRRQLSPEQQKQLMGLVSESVRRGGPRWRGGRGEDTPSTQPATHPGRKGQGRKP